MMSDVVQQLDAAYEMTAQIYSLLNQLKGQVQNVTNGVVLSAVNAHVLLVGCQLL